MKTSIALILALCVASTFQQNSGCVTALEGVINSAVSVANDVKGKHIVQAIGAITGFIRQIEGVLGGACHGLSTGQIKQVINQEVHGSIKNCLDDLIQTYGDAKKLVHDVKHHKIFGIIKEGARTARDFGHVRGHCAHRVAFE